MIIMIQATFLVNNVPVNKILDNSKTKDIKSNISTNDKIDNTNVIIYSKKPSKIVENVYYL